MRKVSTLVGLTVFALAGTAGFSAAAAEAAPSDNAAAPAAPAAEAPATPAAATTAPADSAATESTSAAAAPAPAEQPAHRKLQVGIGFVPAAMGTFKYNQSPTKVVTSDAAFAYGVSISGGYEVLPNFVVGLAPQLLFNVKEKSPDIKTDDNGGVKQIDILARLAYEYPVVETIRVYAEALPGYSLIRNDSGAKGLILAFGIGTAMDIADRYFLNVGAGYQLGFQKWTEGANTYDTSTRFVRVVLGGGIRL
jgi:hypothetical protein